MADIFLSYNREDLPLARRFAEEFERAGLSVWWDQTLHPGEAYDHVTEKALKTAHAVVVLWSPNSVGSRWVRAEATLAERNGTLVPVTIAPCERPIMFELTQTSDLSGWKGDRTDPAWQSLLASVKRKMTLGGDDPVTPSSASLPTADAPPASRLPHPWLATAIAALLAVALGVGLWIARPDAASTVAASSAPEMPAAPARPRIAVLPFTNLSPDPEQAFFTDGMHEEVLNALTNGGAALDVISRTTMMTYRQNPRTVTQLRQELNADYVVEGSVRRADDDVRLTLQLIDAKTDSHLWSQNFDRTLVNAMTLQSEVASAVASQLAVQVSPVADAFTAPPTQDPLAYDMYLQARLAQRLLTGASDPGEMSRVFDLYGQAITLDPDFGLAYLMRVSLGPDRRMPLEEWRKQSGADLGEARRLLGNDPRIDLFEAINAAGGPFANADQTLAMFEAAEARGLKDPEVLETKGTVLMGAGRSAEALALRRHLVSLDPANPRLWLALSADCFLARQPQEALKALDMMTQQLPAGYQPPWEAFGKAIRFLFTGDLDWLTVPDLLPQGTGFDMALREDSILTVLRLQGRFAEILARLATQPGPLMPVDSLFQSYNMGFPPPPVARVRGWTRLLMGERDAARADGREILAMEDLAPSGAGTRVGSGMDVVWLDQLRRAEGHLFAGDANKAIALTRDGLARTPRDRNALIWAYASAMGAATLAWAGEKDEAAGLLEQLATEVPGLAPGSITRDPLYTQPLADNARFQALAARLEAQMTATKL